MEKIIKIKRLYKICLLGLASICYSLILAPGPIRPLIRKIEQNRKSSVFEKLGIKDKRKIELIKIGLGTVGSMVGIFGSFLLGYKLYSRDEPGTIDAYREAGRVGLLSGLWSRDVDCENVPNLGRQLVGQLGLDPHSEFSAVSVIRQGSNQCWMNSAFNSAAMDYLLRQNQGIKPDVADQIPDNPDNLIAFWARLLQRSLGGDALFLREYPMGREGAEPLPPIPDLGQPRTREEAMELARKIKVNCTHFKQVDVINTIHDIASGIIGVDDTSPIDQKLAASFKNVLIAQTKNVDPKKLFDLAGQNWNSDPIDLIRLTLTEFHSVPGSSDFSDHAAQKRQALLDLAKDFSQGKAPIVCLYNPSGAHFKSVAVMFDQSAKRLKIYSADSMSTTSASGKALATALAVIMLRAGGLEIHVPAEAPSATAHP